MADARPPVQQVRGDPGGEAGGRDSLGCGHRHDLEVRVTENHQPVGCPERMVGSGGDDKPELAVGGGGAVEIVDGVHHMVDGPDSGLRHGAQPGAASDAADRRGRRSRRGECRSRSWGVEVQTRSRHPTHTTGRLSPSPGTPSCLLLREGSDVWGGGSGCGLLGGAGGSSLSPPLGRTLFVCVCE